MNSDLGVVSWPAFLGAALGSGGDNTIGVLSSPLDSCGQLNSRPLSILRQRRELCAPNFQEPAWGGRSRMRTP